MRNNARLAAYVASLALAVTTVTAIAPSAQAIPATDPIGVNAGAAWLESQLTDGIVHNTQYNFDDYGLTLDFGMALQNVGDHASTVTAIRNAMASHVDDYVTPFGGPHSYTGALAKLALFVGHPADTTFGGQDLITQLARPGLLDQPDRRADRGHRLHRRFPVRRRHRERAGPGLRRRGAAQRRLVCQGGGRAELPAQAAVPQRWLPAQLHRRQDGVRVSPAPTTARHRSTPPRSP